MNTKELERGQLAVKLIDSYVKPQSIFIGGEAEKLYALENKRTENLRAIATEWARVVGVDKKLYWKQSIPQVLFDTLHNYEIPAAAIAAEAFLEQLGWTVTRPAKV